MFGVSLGSMGSSCVAKGAGGSGRRASSGMVIDDSKIMKE